MTKLFRNLCSNSRRFVFRGMAGAALCVIAAASASAASLIFTYSDPVGDSTGTIDVTQLVVIYDSVTGQYKATLTATNAQPFLAGFRVNLNLFNPSRLPAHSYFGDTLNDYNLATAKTKLILTGSNPSLPFWQVGDVVATNTAASGGQNPPGSTLYRCNVLSTPFGGFLTNEDAIAYGPTGTATIRLATPQDLVAALMDDVQILLEDGVVNGAQANALVAKLSATLASLNNSNTTPACNQVQAFMNQVQAFMNAGTLTQAQGQALLDAAQAILAMVPCS